MKTVILCGGRGTRMREETEYRPKPLVLIGERPILWHIMKIYSHYGFNDFILCVGYKGDMIKRYFMEMCWQNNDFTAFTGSGAAIEYHTQNSDNWQVTISDTGLESQTGRRLKQVERYIGEDTFMLTYGDGLSDIDIPALIENHRRSGRMATITGVNPVSPFGVLQIEDGIVTRFKEKPVLEDTINGGFMVLDKRMFQYIPDTNCALEEEPLHSLALAGEISVYQHRGFWAAIDTGKDIEKMNGLWNAGAAPWKLWS